MSVKIEKQFRFQETLLLDPMFEVPGSEIKSVHITEDCVMGKPPVYVHQSNSTSSTDPPEATDEEDRKYRVKQ